jgi:hypothetical protein
MPTAVLDPDARARVRAELEALEGVRRAVLDDDSPRVYVITDRPETPTDVQVRSVLAANRFPMEGADVQVAHLHGPEPRRRVRFVSATVAASGMGARARVELEWGGESFTGEAEGEAGATMEMRLCASAAVNALDRVMEERVPMRLVGIKGFRAFDTDLVVVLLRGPESGHLVGSAVDPGNPNRSAALAVLNATNRILGNYLFSPADGGDGVESEA